MADKENVETADSVPATKAPSMPMTAREKAEARRRRIIKSSQSRLRVVGGDNDIEVNNNAMNESSNESNPSKITDSNTNNGTELKTDDTTGNSTAKKSTLSGQARLQQMRRRRFKKAAAASATPSSQKPTENTETAKADSDGKDKEKESNVEVQQTQTEPTEVNESQNLIVDGPETLKHSSSYTTADGEEKKYLGVAKMRRKMLSEKKVREEEKPQEVNKSTTQDATTIMMNKQIRQSFIIQFLTLILLYLSGYQLGSKNVTRSNAIHINTNLAMKHESYFVNRLLSLNKSFEESHNQDDSVASFSNAEFFEQQNQQLDNVNDEYHEEYDEFSSFDAGESATFTIDPNKNIDPVFRVNLDLYTQGSSILFVLARQAVKFHRFWVVSLPSFLFSQFRVIYILSTSFIHTCHLHSKRN